MTNEYYEAPEELTPLTKARSVDINTLSQAVSAAFDKLPTEDELKLGATTYAVDTGLVANAYIVALPYAPDSYVDGMTVTMRPTRTNTGAATVNVNGLGVKSIKRIDGSNPLAADITSGGPVTLTYSTASGAFHLPASVQSMVVAAAASAAAAAASEAAAEATVTVTSATAPVDPIDGAEWINSTTGRKYTWIEAQSVWAEMEAAQVVESLAPAEAVRDDLASTASSKGAGLVGFSALAEYAAGTVGAHLQGDDVTAPARRGFWGDEGDGASIHRLRDRVFAGEGVKHTGNRYAPYGDTWLATEVATWPEKNAQFIFLSSEEKIGLLAGAQATDAGTGNAIGIASFCYNERTGGTARAMYADVTHTGTATATYGLEITVSNRGTDVQTNSYSLSGGVLGMHITPEGGSNYTLGDTDTPATEATAPGTVAVNIGAGSGGTANKRWNLGIRFANNSLTGCDGTTGTAVAVGMAKGHTIEWRASNAILGATLRSDVNATAGQDTGIIFSNNKVRVTGTSEIDIATFSRDAAGAGPVNYLDFKNARTNVAPTISAKGSDAAVPLALQSQSTGVIRFLSHDGTSEHLRINPGASAAVNYMTVAGAVAASPVTIGAAGSDTDIDIRFTPKGAGYMRFGTYTANADAPITGYVTIKDASGNLRKLAIIA